jgi:hypothetical protein
MLDIAKTGNYDNNTQFKVTIHIFPLNQSTILAGDICITSQVKENYKMEQNPGKIKCNVFTKTIPIKKKIVVSIN